MQWLRKRKAHLMQSIETQKLLSDIRRAELEWNVAEWQFNYAVGEEHVDYAICCLEAAEKKYGILMREAKRHWSGAAELANQEGIG